MSYYNGIGGVEQVANVAQVALRVADDPALPTVVSLISEIKAATASKGPSAPTAERGVGLSRIVTPLRGFVAYKKHPWIFPVFAAGAVLSIFSLGVMTGRARR